MKVLLTTTPGLGHILPLLPFVRELRARGHELRWVGGHQGLDEIRALGIEVVPAGTPELERQQEVLRRHPELPSVPEEHRQVFAFPKVFAELAAPLIAAAAGIPSACHGFGQVVPAGAVHAAGEVMALHWRAAGLEPDPFAGSYRGLYIDLHPPSLRSEEMDQIPRVQQCRPAEGRPASGATVYVTFGTLFNRRSDALRTAVLAAASVAEDVLVTVGRGADPGDLGPVPDHVRVEHFVPQAEVLPTCAAVVCHGGSGTLLAALAHGIPVVCLPQGADQFANAANVGRVGAGVAVSGSAADRSGLSEATAQVLRDPAPRRAAQLLAQEIAGMPGSAETARAIEALVR